MVNIGQQQQFTATVIGTGKPSQSVSWSASGGSISQTGLYTAPIAAGSYTVTATSAQDSSRYGTAAVTVNDRPRGLFALGTQQTIPIIAPISYVEGLTLRVSWADLNPAEGVYDFSAVDNALRSLEACGKRMNLELYAVVVPAFLLAKIPVSEQWSATAPGGATVMTPVPWNATALAGWGSLVGALAAHRLPLADGTTTNLADHPSLLMVESPIVGLQAVRDLSGQLTIHAGYSRAGFLAAVLQSVHASRNGFPRKFGFLFVTRMNDADLIHPMDEDLMVLLMNDFNHPGQPSLGFFQETLSDAGPKPDGLGTLLAEVKDRTYIVFQALTSWVNPFTNPTAVSSGRAVTGIEFAYRTYGATYVELYLTDIQDPKQKDDLIKWNSILLGQTPAPVGVPADVLSRFQ